MVQRARKIIWSVNAQAVKKSIFFYWNNRNKSTTYSEKLELIFKETLKRIAIFSDGSLATNDMNVRFVLTRDYYLIFEVTETAIIVLDIWDTRQNPVNFPIK
jgi:toxin YoeB